MGSSVTFSDGMKLTGQAPDSGHWKLIRNGQVVSESDGFQFEFTVKEAGIYRAEVWLNIAGEERIWILSNPIYVGGKI